jgi:hypothetical protein
MLPELFVHMYYFGAPLQSALLRVWAKSRQLRVHTGLLIIQRPRRGEEVEAIRLTYAPDSSKPMGMDLPMTASVCGCWDKESRWQAVHRHHRHGEDFQYLRSTCCGTELHIAVFNEHRRRIHVHGTTVYVERWDAHSSRFPFDTSRMVAMRVSVSNVKHSLKAVSHWEQQ